MLQSLKIYKQSQTSKMDCGLTSNASWLPLLHWPLCHPWVTFQPLHPLPLQLTSASTLPPLRQPLTHTPLFNEQHQFCTAKDLWIKRFCVVLKLMLWFKVINLSFHTVAWSSICCMNYSTDIYTYMPPKSMLYGSLIILYYGIVANPGIYYLLNKQRECSM